MMQRVEKEIRDQRTAEEYVAALLDLLSAERCPSPQMLERVGTALSALEGS